MYFSQVEMRKKCPKSDFFTIYAIKCLP